MRELRRLERLHDLLAARTVQRVDDPARRQAAVALLLVAEPDRILLIRRALRDGDPWSGHIALPGGRREPGDVDLAHTAVRETAEETGIELAPASAVELDDLAPMTPVLPPIIVRPHLFLLDREPMITPSDEVAEAVWVPFDHLADPAIRRPADLEVRGLMRRVVGYHLPAGLLWGMTERILAPVLEAWSTLAD